MDTCSKRIEIMSSIVCVIPARLGSKRLPRKNLRELDGISLLARAIRKAQSSGVFDEIWVSSESTLLGDVAKREGARFHLREEHLGSDTATSEDFIADFLQSHHSDWLVQLHSIAPMLTVEDVREFVAELSAEESDAVFSVVSTRLEAVLGDEPVNFSFNSKTNSQELKPVKEISWAITAWRARTFVASIKSGECATYAGQRLFVEIPAIAGHVIKTEWDLQVAEALLPLAQTRGSLI